ncbi:MAG: hypothetical protein KJO75_23180, partial [Dactylosporangium sp.]|nr:hypothetical protein [Dactylosporangium sp.]
IRTAKEEAMDHTDPITNEADIINRTDITARLAWLEHSLATPAVLDGLPDLDAAARQEEESREFGDAVAQQAWSPTRWAAEYTDGWHTVRFGTVAYRVHP